VQQLPPVTENFGIDSDAVPTNTTRVIFVAGSSGNVRIARAALVDTGTVTDVDFDLLKNGVSVLSAAINVVNGTGDGNFVAGTISTAPFVQDDIFTADLAVTSSTGALGPVLLVHFEEDPT
jgi:hypothetical protein